MEVKQEVSDKTFQAEIYCNDVDDDPLDICKIKIKEEPLRESTHDTFDYVDLKDDIKTELKQEEHKLPSSQERHTNPSCDDQLPSDSYGGKIVGGVESDIDFYPYQLSLQYLGLHSCGASLIAPTWVLTAAHCVYRVFTPFISIRAGATARQTGGEVIRVKKKFMHKLYDDKTIDYDIALLELQEPADPDYAEAVSLPEEGSDVKGGDIGTIVGWGFTSEKGTASSSLRVTEIPILHQSDCKRVMGKLITDRMFCAGLVKGGKDACQGDSGGPFVVDGVQVGIISWGSGCGEARRPGVYTNVAALRSYIKQVSGI
ncbi:trypsin-1-like isoform X1 [Diabrotica virgifera virgifera]|uniref:Peptidase S1 domain-containing protein n=1 Tax=Diabrotica virgifera virgifera TaxID=50390 RepID=A0ABM5K017_DIAVI|nr:trypsin-1-like isoform X1 [Diabrotica virgifera virgifera]